MLQVLSEISELVLAACYVALLYPRIVLAVQKGFYLTLWPIPSSGTPRFCTIAIQSVCD